MADMEQSDGKLWLLGTDPFDATHRIEISGPGLIVEYRGSVRWYPEPQFTILKASTPENLLIHESRGEAWHDFRAHQFDLRYPFRLTRIRKTLSGGLMATSPWKPGDPDTEPDSVIVKAARALCASLDGTYGKTWSQVADDLERRALPSQGLPSGLPSEVSSSALAALVRLAMAGME